jgi:2-iminoacetate synthase
MPTTTQPSLRTFADRIRATDAHAERRLALVNRAERLLEGEETTCETERVALADRLERWRCQLLNERRDEWSAEDQRLADALDLAAGRIAGRPARPPRNARRAVQSASRAEATWEAALAWLEPDADLAELSARAADVTAAEFGPLAPGDSGVGGRRMLLYAPIYLSSYCVNHCVYCGFNYAKGIQRRHLGVEEAVGEANVLLGRGLKHQLLLAGEFPQLHTTEYFVEIIRRLVALGVRPAVEIAPRATSSYAAMAAAGACGVTLYQETYDERRYARYHPRGPKASYDWRLEGLDRAGDAGMERLGLGVLLGLADPRADLLALMRHADYLHGRFPDRTLALSLPRINEPPGSFRPPFVVDDETFVRLYCVLRLAFPKAQLVLSTRESVAMRSRLAPICITQLSAGSCTAPGGYAQGTTDAQFPIHDRRSVAEVADWLRRAGFAPAWDIPPREE